MTHQIDPTTAALARTSDERLYLLFTDDIAAAASDFGDRFMAFLRGREGCSSVGPVAAFVRDVDQRPGEDPAWTYMIAAWAEGRSSLPAVDATELLPDAVVRRYAPFGALAVRPEHAERHPQWRTGINAGHVFMALTNSLPGQDAEFQRWYDEEHLSDVVTVDPYLSGRRYRLDTVPTQQSPYRYLAFYEVEGSIPQMHANLEVAAAAGALTMTDALDHVDSAWIYARL